jgi:pimeloyl-ACP methyl ester carboxylesterase
VRGEEPTAAGHVVRDGVRIAYEVYGTSGSTLVLLPCWIIVHARAWKAQIADLAQDCRIVVVDGRGNGASDRPRRSTLRWAQKRSGRTWSGARRAPRA